MTSFDAWTVVVAPFPFVDSPQAKPRPCLVLSGRSFNDSHGHSLCAMITRPLETTWPTDLPIGDLATAGLPAPSVIRWKLFTLPNAIFKRAIGSLGPPDRVAAQKVLGEILPG
ncbi:MAG TPA: type II toxin-antitoxin system PemK/MazF family toxin [Rhodospirillaceae bacterium]|nr:type II toxin-antitoxin system PemK/MazF family toxin [Rhodospirillaceae bacterium]